MSDSGDDTTTINVKGLDQLLKALKTKLPVARVGVLGSDAARGEGASNAEVGAVHEFGSIKRNIPSRSFLRVPISEHLEKKMEESGAFNKDVLAEVLKKGTVKPWLEKVAVTAEGIVADAFDTGGFGQWPQWQDPNYSNNANQLLVDTQQLRNSITSEVKD